MLKDMATTVDGLIAILQRAKDAGAYYVAIAGSQAVVVTVEPDDNSPVPALRAMLS